MRYENIDPSQLPFKSLPPSGTSKTSNYSLEGEALSLLGGLGSGNLSKTRATLNQLKLLLGMISNSSSAGRVRALIGEAIAKAKQHIADLEADEGKTPTVDIQEKFELGIYVMMSAEAKHFYQQIDPNINYAIAPVGKNGEIITAATKQVHGKTLRRRLSLVKFHSLDTANKKKVLTESFGAKEAVGEGTPKDIAQLQKKKHELYLLHAALDDMEAYKAHKINLEHDPELAAEMIEKNHAIMLQAHDQIDEVISKYDTLISDIHNGEAMAHLKVAKLKMKRMLKDEVIDYVLLGKLPAVPAISGGVGTELVSAYPTGLATQFPLTFPHFSSKSNFLYSFPT